MTKDQKISLLVVLSGSLVQCYILYLQPENEMSCRNYVSEVTGVADILVYTFFLELHVTISQFKTMKLIRLFQ